MKWDPKLEIWKLNHYSDLFGWDLLFAVPVGTPALWKVKIGRIDPITQAPEFRDVLASILDLPIKLVYPKGHTMTTKEQTEYVDNPQVTKEVMQQYEAVRRVGQNMYDIFGVRRAAHLLQCFDLFNLITVDLHSQDYREGVYCQDILMHFNHYMRKYDIKQNDV